MRRFLLVFTFLLLVGAVYFTWQNRFERSVGQRTVRLQDLRSVVEVPPGARWLESEEGPRLVLGVDRSPPVVMRMELPGIPRADFLHLRARISTRKLEPGNEVWQDGKCLVSWHLPAHPEVPENDPIASGQGNSRQDVELVMTPEKPGSVPLFVVQNAGRGGEFEVTRLEISALVESLVWKIGKWLLVAGLALWIIFWINPKGRGAWIRAACVSAVWVGMTLNFVVPGPWRSFHSFGESFAIGPENHATPPATVAPEKAPPRPSAAPVGSHATVTVVGDMPERTFTLRLKNYAAKVKELLHIGLLFPPVLLAACLAGRRAALWHGVLFSLAVEAAQIFYGFGCDRTDLLDLACDAAGIALALWVHHLLRKWWPVRVIA